MPAKQVVQPMSPLDTLCYYTGLAIRPVMAGVRHGLSYVVDKTKPLACDAPKPATHSIPSVEDAPTEQLDRIVAKLSAEREKLDLLTDAERAELARQTVAACAASTESAVDDLIKHHGAYECGSGEVTVAYAGIAQQARTYAETFELFAAGKAPTPMRVTKCGDDQLAVTVFPKGLYENAFFPGYAAELWLEPGAPVEHERPGRDAPARTACLLGAGNQAVVLGTDILNFVFREHCVVVCKLNAVNDFLLPSLRRALRPLIEAGFVELVSGNVATGTHLAHHELVEVFAMTGSDKTHDAILWGGHGDVGARKADPRAAPNLTKPVSAELGCVVPLIVVPGEWSEAELDRKARELVASKVHNAGYNCLSTQAVVTAAWWPQRERFLTRVRHHLDKAWLRTPYYPGAAERAAAFRAAYPDQAEVLGAKCDEDEAGGCALRPTLVTGLDAAARARDARCCTQEVWSAVLTEMPLETGEESVPAFLEAAARFCNEELWGDLTAWMFIHPAAQARHADAVERAIAALRYGSLGVNCWSGVGYFLPKLTWGAMPGHTARDIQSGRGLVHNGCLYKRVQRSVLRGTWLFPGYIPFWIHDNANGQALCHAAAKFFARPSFYNFVVCALNALLTG